MLHIDISVDNGHIGVDIARVDVDVAHVSAGAVACGVHINVARI